MLRLLCLFSLVISFSLFAKDLKVTEDKMTFMGVIELPMDVDKSQALEIAKFIKQEFKIDQVSVRLIGSRTHGISIQSKYDGKENFVDSLLEKMRTQVTKRFGKNTVSGWNVADTVYFIQ